jgi:D-glycero-D-manno-heptose 1,7-bisphosphate phosphatase
MNKAAFLDRDGVINIDHGYVFQPEKFEFIDGVFDACRHLQELGYLLIVITNQSGIARGMFTEQQFQQLTDWMLARFREQGVTITAVYHCPHHPDYGSESERHCTCRKPAPGMLLNAMRDHHIDPATSLMVGDKGADMQAAAAAGVARKVLVRSGQKISQQDEGLADEVWASVRDLVELNEQSL